jgi:PAS domain S-box-containing protein
MQLKQFRALLSDLSQYTAASILYVVLTIAALIIAIFEIGRGAVEPGAILAIVLIPVTFLLHLRHWKYSATALVVLVSMLIALFLPEPYVTEVAALPVLLPGIIASLVSPRRLDILGGTLVCLGILLVRAGWQGTYFDATTLAMIGVAVICLLLTRLVLEKSQTEYVKQSKMVEEITNNMRDVFYLVEVTGGTSGKVMYLSPAIESVWGDSPASLLGSNLLWFQRIVDEDKAAVHALVQKVIAEKAPSNGNFRVRHKDGSIHYVESNTFPILDSSDNVIRYAGVARDVTEGHRAQEQINKLDALKDKFIEIISHEMQTPLSEVRVSAEMMLDERMGSLSDAQKQFLNAIAQSNSVAINRLRDFITLLDVERGSLTLQKQQGSLSDIAESVVGGYAKAIRAKDLKVELAVAKLPSFEMDIEKMRVAIDKLVENSIMYSSKGGTIKVATLATANGMRVEVSDAGIGVPESEQSRLFESFHRASNASLASPDGAGIGLALAKAIVEKHGGKTGFTSNENKGSQFWIEIPTPGR